MRYGRRLALQASAVSRESTFADRKKNTTSKVVARLNKHQRRRRRSDRNHHLAFGRIGRDDATTSRGRPWSAWTTHATLGGALG